MTDKYCSGLKGGTATVTLSGNSDGVFSSTVWRSRFPKEPHDLVRRSPPATVAINHLHSPDRQLTLEGKAGSHSHTVEPLVVTTTILAVVTKLF